MKRPDKNCWVKWGAKDAKDWAKNKNINQSNRFSSHQYNIVYYESMFNFLYGYWAADKMCDPEGEVKSVEEFKALFEEEKEVCTTPQCTDSKCRVPACHYHGKGECTGQKKVEITEEQAKLLPKHVLKIVAPYLVDRSVDIGVSQCISDRYTNILIKCNKDGELTLDTKNYDWTLKGDILTPLKKL